MQLLCKIKMRNYFWSVWDYVACHIFSADIQMDFDKLDLNLSLYSLRNVKEIQNLEDFLSFIDHIWFCGFYKNFYPVYLKKAIDVEHIRSLLQWVDCQLQITPSASDLTCPFYCSNYSKIVLLFCLENNFPLGNWWLGTRTLAACHFLQATAICWTKSCDVFNKMLFNIEDTSWKESHILSKSGLCPGNRYINRFLQKITECRFCFNLILPTCLTHSTWIFSFLWTAS